RKAEATHQPKEWNQAVVERELNRGKVGTDEDPAVQIPSGDAEEIEEPRLLDLESATAELVEELSTLVTAMMLERPIERTVERSKRRDQKNQAASRLEDVAQRAERPLVVPDVLEDVQAKDR